MLVICRPCRSCCPVFVLLTTDKSNLSYSSNNKNKKNNKNDNYLYDDRNYCTVPHFIHILLPQPLHRDPSTLTSSSFYSLCRRTVQYYCAKADFFARNGHPQVLTTLICFDIICCSYHGYSLESRYFSFPSFILFY